MKIYASTGNRATNPLLSSVPLLQYLIYVFSISLCCYYTLLLVCCDCDTCYLVSICIECPMFIYTCYRHSLWAWLIISTYWPSLAPGVHLRFPSTCECPIWYCCWSRSDVLHVRSVRLEPFLKASAHCYNVSFYYAAIFLKNNVLSLYADITLNVMFSFIWAFPSSKEWEGYEKISMNIHICLQQDLNQQLSTRSRAL